MSYPYDPHGSPSANFPSADASDAKSPYAASPFSVPSSSGATYAAYPSPSTQVVGAKPLIAYQAYLAQGAARAQGATRIGGYIPTVEERSQASMVYWLTIALGLAGLAFLGPLLYMGADKTPFVRHHARQAMNVFLTGLIAGVGIAVAVVFISLVTFGLGALLFVSAPLFSIYPLVAHIIGGTKAGNGQWALAPALPFLK